MTKTILLTGFEPFNKELINPSWEAVKTFQDAVIDNQAKVKIAQLPCKFNNSITVLKDNIIRHNPSIVLCVGQAGGRAKISLERVAINVDDAAIPDNKGFMPIDTKIIKNAPSAYFSSLPIKAIV